jgi:hypothetical protein
MLGHVLAVYFEYLQSFREYQFHVVGSANWKEATH